MTSWTEAEYLVVSTALLWHGYPTTQYPAIAFVVDAMTFYVPTALSYRLEALSESAKTKALAEGREIAKMTTRWFALAERCAEVTRVGNVERDVDKALDALARATEVRRNQLSRFLPYEINPWAGDSRLTWGGSGTVNVPTFP